MPGCDQISQGALYDCQNPLQGGAKARLILINLDDYGAATTNSNDVITALTLQANKAAYVFEGFKNSLVKSEEMVNPDSKQSVFKHKIDFAVYDISQAQKNNLQRMALGRFIAITENTQKGANTFEVYGLNSGLIMSPGVLRASNANNGTFRISLMSPEGEEEVKLPQTFFNTDYATTLAAINGLTFSPTITSVSPGTVAPAGGTAVTITGTNFFGGVGVNQVSTVFWVRQDQSGTRIQQASFTVVSNTSITLNSVALTAGSYKIEVNTSRGTVLSLAMITAS